MSGHRPFDEIRPGGTDRPDVVANTSSIEIDVARVRAHPEEAAAVINGASLLVDLISRKVALPGYVIREMFNWAATFQRLVDNVVVPHETQEDASPRCDCGSRVLRSDVTVCADCGRWQ